MAVEILYTNNTERRAAIIEQEAAGLTLQSDDFNVGPNSEHRLTFDIDTKSPLDVPDPDGAIMDGLTRLGRVRVNQLLRDYPVFLVGLERRNWTVVRETLDQALAEAAITQQEYDGLNQLLADHRIPSSGRG